MKFPVLVFLAIPWLAAAVPPLSYEGPPVSSTADGGLRPVVGVQNIQVYRANRTATAHTDGLAHTYVHQPMLAWCYDRFWLEYLSAPVNEHDNPTDSSLTTSIDGLTWTTPRIVFPAFDLPNGEKSITHQRMGFFVAPNGRLLVLAFHGKSPAPNDGTGIGRVVREIHQDGTFGPIYFIRLNVHQPFPGFTLPYPLYNAAPDAGFVAACEALLADHRFTSQWWEEDQLDDTGRYSLRGKALSFVTRPDGSTLGIVKNRLVSVSTDRGVTWAEKEPALGLPNNSSKNWLQRTSDARYALFFNPTDRLRNPLAVSTSGDCEHFTGLLAVHGEVPDQRFFGDFKNMGPQYVRGIVEGNGVPPDAARATWVAYSVNKEDIWVSRVPVPITGTVSGQVNDKFEEDQPGSLPQNWNIYAPLWAPVRVVETKDADSHALELKDEDPYDYARASRVFPSTHGVKISFKVFARQTTGRLEIELLDAAGARPFRLAFEEDGHLRACHEGQWLDAGGYTANAWHTFTFEISPKPETDRCAVTLDGKPLLKREVYFTDPVQTVERLSFRTGPYRDRGYGGRDLPGADLKSPAAAFLIDEVIITPVP